MLGIMLSVMFVLSSLERILPPLPFMPPSARIGLANVVVMYSVFFIGAKEAFALNILKAALITLSRGPISGALSLAGGLLSVCAVVVLVKVFGQKISMVMISVASAMAHNLGQLMVFAFIMGLSAALYYLPILMAISIFLGIITGITLNVILPVIKKGGY
ncbi:MAG: Gx transporter family protein [Clostridiales bacterium]|jgi:heptaprenyl diphosphate synthase|nr:Gx transporter family protein [Clostridiales bacterium]